LSSARSDRGSGSVASIAAGGGNGGRRLVGDDINNRSVSADKLHADDFKPMLHRARMCKLAPGEVAFEQGSLPNAVYLLAEGECQVECTNRAAQVTHVVGKLSAGDHFGEGALLEGRERRNSTVRCVHPSGCQVGVLGKGAFEAMLRAQPELLDVFEETMRRRNRKRLRSMIELAVERSQCETRTLRAGEVLFAQGEAAEAFFVVDSGCVQMAFTTSDGRQLPSRTHHMGDIFGASGLLAGDGTRRDTATALEHTVLKAIPHARVTTLMRQDSQLAEGLRRATTFSALNGVQGSAAERRGRKLREAPAWSGYAFVGKHPSREQAR